MILTFLITYFLLPLSFYTDIHCHIACVDEEVNGCYISPQMKNSFKYKVYLKAMGANFNSPKKLSAKDDRYVLEKLYRNIKKSKLVNKVVLLALDGVISEDGNLNRKKTQIHIPNSYILKATKEFDTFLFGASINPNRHDAIERLIQAKKDGAVLIKWIPSVMHINPNDPKHIPFYLKMKELGLFLLSHTSTEKSFTTASDSYSDPLRLELALSHGVTVVAAHSAAKGKSEGGRNFNRFLHLVRKYPNLFGDISALTQINRYKSLELVLSRKELRGRLLYGSDWPLHFFPLVSPVYFSHVIGARAAYQISRRRNVWDRDVLLKKALGAPEEIFANVNRLLDNPYFWESP